MADRAQVSGQYAGAFSRLVAFMADWALVTVVAGLGAAGAGFAVEIVLRREVDLAATNPGFLAAGFVAWQFLYFFLGLAIQGRTPGKALLGLRVVTRHGAPIGVRAALFRTLALPLSMAPLGLGFIGAVIGRERRALHDLLAGTCVVYDWGDRPAELPAPLTDWLRRQGALETAGVQDFESGVG